MLHLSIKGLLYLALFFAAALSAGQTFAAEPTFLDSSISVLGTSSANFTTTGDFTATGTNRYLFFIFESSDHSATSVTWNGDPMAALASSTEPFTGRRMQIYGIADPDLGSEYDAIVNMESGGAVTAGMLLLYAGAAPSQGGVFSSNNGTPVTSANESLTTSVSGASLLFAIFAGADSANIAPGGDAIFRIGNYQSGVGSYAVLERGPFASIGNYAVSSTFAVAGEHHLLFEIRPVIITSPSPLFVIEGGTGATSFVTNGILIGNGTDPIQIISPGSAYQVLRIPPGSGAPTFGAIDLSRSAAVTGVLSAAFGGTGTATIFSPGSIIFASASGTYAQNNGQLFWDDINAFLGVGTSSPSHRLEVVGTVAATHYKGIGGVPSVAVGSCAGIGGSASVSGTDVAGRVVLTTGTTTPANADCLSVTYVEPYGNAPHVVFSPSNKEAAALSGAKSVYASSTTASFTFAVGATSLSNSTTYTWEYHIVE